MDAFPGMEKRHKNKGYATAFGSALILSLTAIFIRHLTQAYELPALVLAFWREVMVALGLAIILAVTKPALLRGVRKHMGFLVAYGLVLALFNALWTLSVSLNGAAVATVLAYSSAGFTVFLGWLILKEELTITKMAAVVLTLAGCALIVNAFDVSIWKLNPVSMVSGIVSGLFYAIYSIMGRTSAKRGINTWTTLLYIFAFASMFMLAFNLFSGGVIPGAAEKAGDLLWLGREWKGWLILIVLAIGPTLMGYGLYNVSLQYLPSSVINLVVTVEPVFTALVAYIAFGEMLTISQMLGAGLIMFAVLALRLGKEK